MAIPKFDPASLSRHYDSRVIPAWQAQQEAVTQREQAYEASSRRERVTDEALRAKFEMDRGGH